MSHLPLSSALVLCLWQLRKVITDSEKLYLHLNLSHVFKGQKS